MKRILAVVLLVSILTGTLSACNQNNSTQESNSNTNTTQKQDFSGNISDNVSGMDSETTTTQATIVKKLSDDCDKVLASGKDPNGDEWELVATEEEDYSGTTIRLGVIKNNEWVVPLTTECPFLESDGSLCSGFYDIHEDNFNLFYYIGSSCFVYTSYYEPRFAEIIWNVETDKQYRHDYSEEGRCMPIVFYDPKKEVPDNEGYLIFYDSNPAKYINVKTMEIKEIKSQNYIDTDSNIYPYSDGLFATSDFDTEKYGWKDCYKFFNLDGDLVIDLSDYYIIDDDSSRDCLTSTLVFKDDKCSFKIHNDQGTEYIITIDKQGNVIDSVKV